MRILLALAITLGFFALALAGAGAVQAPDAPPAVATEETYPPRRHASCVTAFSMAEDVRADVLTKSLAALSTRAADAKILYGPRTATARPSRVFVLIEAPAEIEPKDLLKAVQKGAKDVEVLTWTCLQSGDRTLGRGLGAGMPGMTPRDFVLGMSNDLRWFEARGGFLEFFTTPGKLSAEVLADRLKKLAQPFGVQDVGTVVVETVRWPLARAKGHPGAPAGSNEADLPLDAAVVKRAEKAIAKLRGVRAAKIDAVARTIEVQVALEELARGLLPIALPGGAPTGAPDGTPSAPSAAAGATADEEAPRMRFDTNPIFDALAKESIAVVAPTPAAPAAR